MPSYNVTLDDASPLWKYSEGWDDSATPDPAYVLYANESFHATHTQGSSVKIVFNGTGVHLYGAFRSNHDDYSVTVGGERTIGSGYRPDPNEEDDFQLPLFNKTDLAPGQHEVVLTDVTTQPNDRPWLDLDFGIITLGDGDTSTKSDEIILDDTGTPNITYSGDWLDTRATTSSQYYRETMHRVNVQGATATIKFYGNAIQVFGATSSNHGPYTVALDGSSKDDFDGQATNFHPKQMLYLASSLELANHTLVITHTSTNPNVWFDLDYVIVSVWPNTTQPLPPNPDPVKKGTNVAAIAGGVGGGVGGLLLLGLLAFLFWRRRRRGGQWESQEKFEVDPLPPSATTGTLTAGAMGAGAARHHPGTSPGLTSQGGYLGSPSEGAYLRTPTNAGSEAHTAPYGMSPADPGPHEPLLGHVDLPPPGYDQVLRNTQGPSTTSESGTSEVASSSAAGTSSSGARRPLYPPEKEIRLSVGGRRMLPTTPPEEH